MRTAVLVLLLASVGCTKPGADTTDPKAGGPLVIGDGPDWTYAELLTKIRANGYPQAKMSASREQSYLLTPGPDDSPGFCYDVLEKGGRYSDFEKLGFFTCDKMDSAKDAREAAGRHEKGAWAWGRYYFRGTDETLAKVKKALK